MLFINHIAGGLSFTVTFCAFADINIYEKPEYLALTVFSSALPDIDYTKSVLGKVCYPISNYIEKNYGHRTITHSLLACVVYTILIATIERIIQAEHLALIAFTSYLSHLIFDMSTRSGIPFFYPLQKYRCVLPANPKLRLRTGDIRAEGIIFFCFIFLNLLSLDLAANGFWTSYNKVFATFSHLQREQSHNPQPLYINIRNKYTGETTQGYMLESTESKTILLSDIGFEEIQNDGFEIIDFEHKGIKKEEKLSFEEISIDSLNTLLEGNILEANIFATNPVRYRDKKGLPSEGKTVQITNRISPKVYQVQVDSLASEVQRREVQKKILQEQINLELEKETQSQKELRLLTQSLQKIQESYKTLSPFEQGKAIKEMATLESNIDNFKLYKADISLYNIKLAELNIQRVEPLKLSGIVNKLIIR